MTRDERIEVGLIIALTAGSVLARPLFPSETTVGEAVLGLSALLLAQSLVRDVSILLHRRGSGAQGARRELLCFCLESTVGTTGLVVGGALLGLAATQRVSIEASSMALAAGATLTLGFLIKDLVISWKPWGLRREKDHLNLIVRWKRR